MARVVLTLGSNIDKERNLPAAVRLLAERARLIAVSSVYETRPTGLLDQPNFFNAAVLLETDESPAELKDGLLREIETRLKRVRQADKNAPRTIDLDIALYDDRVFDYTPADGRPRHIPDRDLLRFAHCALPVADLLPDMAHPETGEPLAAVAARLELGSREEDEPAISPRPDIDLGAYLNSR
jgi:2-amino-4-hydroxy-6-hydroxymethyldihydropteridine diphosphokinase